MLVFDTICALSTPPYKSALAIIRLSGNKALDILLNITRKKKEDIKANVATYLNIYEDKNDLNTLIDKCVIVYYKGPKSYTGFDSVDFFIHGNMIICDQLLDTLVKYGARRAQKGEFSAQAYFNSKFDLLAAQGINDLINATNIRSKNIALYTLKGENSKFILDIKDKLLSIITSLEYYVEDHYLDNDLEALSEINKTYKTIEDISLDIKKNIITTKKNNLLYQGVKVALVGKTNVGKSTLLNLLLKKDKAIVSSTPGTTRDIVEGEIEYKGIKFVFYDTAGIRKTTNKIEKLGINKSINAIKEANIILFISDTNFNFIKDNNLEKYIKNKPLILVHSKSDLKTSSKEISDISISKNKFNLNELMDLIILKLDLDNISLGYFLGKREEDYLKRILNELDDVNSSLKTNQIDIISDTIRIIINTINEFLGKSEAQTMEDIYESLFSHFCLGK